MRALSKVCGERRAATGCGAPEEIKLSEIIRLVDGPLAPFGDADQLRSLIVTDPDHRALYGVFLEVRDAAAKILESTSVADIVGGNSKARKRSSGKKKRKKDLALSIVHKGVNGS
jgi:DNA-binding IscR family transcriptional regulator